MEIMAGISAMFKFLNWLLGSNFRDSIYEKQIAINNPNNNRKLINNRTLIHYI